MVPINVPHVGGRFTAIANSVKSAPLIHPIVPTPMLSCLAPPVEKTSAGATPSFADTIIEIPVPTITIADNNATARKRNDFFTIVVSL
jgi:hypothetical protein